MPTMWGDMKSSNRRLILSCSLVSALLAAPVAHAWQITPPNMGGMGTLTPTGNGVPPGRTHSGNDTTGPIEVPEDFVTLKLAPGFLLDVQVFNEPELSGSVRVDNNGNVKLPLINPIHVAGSTMPEAETAITKSFLDQKVLLHPQVTLNILQYSGGKVDVLGEVQSPGEVDLLRPRSLDVVLSRAGGETITASDTIQIKHVVNGTASTESVKYGRNQPMDMLRNITVNPGDTVIVPRAGIVYVLGAVGRPGGYIMQEDGRLNVIQALALADGTTYAASIGSIRIVRKKPDGTYDDIPIKFRDMTDGKAPPLILEAEDIVYVPVSRAKAVMTQGITASTSSALIYLK